MVKRGRGGKPRVGLKKEDNGFGGTMVGGLDGDDVGGGGKRRACCGRKGGRLTRRSRRSRWTGEHYKTIQPG